jgi:predicted DNA-binding ribbon-helix-helix protein
MPTIHIYVHEDLYENLVRLATEKRMTVNKLIASILEKWVREQNAQKVPTSS